MSDVRTFADYWTDAWRPAERQPPSQWVRAHVRLPARVTANPGPYDLDAYPFWRPVLDLVDDPAVEILVIEGAAQLGKTTALLAALLERSKQSPAPGMLATPDRDSCWELRDRFYAFAEESRVDVPPEWRRNDRVVEVDRALWNLAWAGSTQRLSGKACKWVLCTECDRWPQKPTEGQTQDLIARRTRAFRRSLVIYESTPQDEQSFIESLYELSDRRRWLCPCPHCGQYQELRYFVHRDGPDRGRGGLAGYVDASGRYLTPDEARAAAYYLCERGCKIEQRHKLPMIQAGQLVPAGQTVDRRGRLVGQPERPPRIAGVQFSALLAPTVSWGGGAADYLDSRTSPAKLQSFWNNSVGRKWTRRTKAADWKRLGRRLAHPHRRGTIPAAAVFLTAGADKQADRAYWVLRAWAADGTSWLIDWGMESQRSDEKGNPRPGSDLVALDAIVSARWPIVGGPNAQGKRELAIRHLGIDTRWQTKLVNAWIKTHAGDRVLPLMGFGGDRLKAATWQIGYTDRDATTNKPLPGSRIRYDLNVDALKAVLAHKFAAALDEPGAWWLYETVLADGETYLRQLTNEGQTVELDKKTRRPRTVWRVGDEAVGNHYWDCEVYALFLAELVTGGDWPAFARLVAEQPQRIDSTPPAKARTGGGDEQLSAR